LLLGASAEAHAGKLGRAIIEFNVVIQEAVSNDAERDDLARLEAIPNASRHN
jgi:hypothetical protein